MSAFIGIALAPFMLLLMVWLVAAPVKRALIRRMPECWLKRLLLFSWKV